MIPYEILKELVIHGVRFSYESYDHKKAIEEIKQLQQSGTYPGVVNNPIAGAVNYLFGLPEHSWQVPDEIKKNHIVWRAGRIWDISFNRKREMCRFKIGNRYPKAFQLSDFGLRVKPMIFKSDDKYDLIGQGLAIEETI